VVWSELLSDEPDRQAAFALDAVLLEAIFLLGPVLMAGLVLLASPAFALLVAAGLAAAGTLAFAATGLSRAWRGLGRAPRTSVTAGSGGGSTLPRGKQPLARQGRFPGGHG
jgi:hypothetical protein